MLPFENENKMKHTTEEEAEEARYIPSGEEKANWGSSFSLQLSNEYL